MSFFKEKLIDRGYSELEINEAFKSALLIPRRETLQKSENKSNSKTTPLTLVTKYQPKIHKLASALRKHWSVIYNDPEANKLFTRPPIVAYKRGRNISDLIASAVVKVNN